MTTNGRRNKVRLRDDAMQWAFDRAIQETGRVQHFFEEASRHHRVLKRTP